MSLILLERCLRGGTVGIAGDVVTPRRVGLAVAGLCLRNFDRHVVRLVVEVSARGFGL